MEPELNDPEYFTKKYGNYQPVQTRVPVSTVRPLIAPIIGGETPEEARARRQEEAYKASAEARAQTQLGISSAQLGLSLEDQEMQRRAQQQSQSKEQFDRVAKLRTEFQAIPDVKDFVGIKNSTRQIVELAKGEGSPMGEIASVFLIMKALDPASVVREGEFATVQNATSVAGRFANYYNKILKGQGLSPEQREDMARTALSIYNQRKLGYDEFAGTYRNLLEKEGANPDEQGVTVAPVLEFQPKPLPSDSGKAAPTSTFAPLQPGQPVQTEADIAAERQLQEAWNSGSSVDQMMELNLKLGRGAFKPDAVSAMQNARAKGERIRFSADPTGTPTTLQNVMASPVGQSVGGFALGAVNAATLGTIDEIAPVIGLTQEQVEAAKNYYRQQAPLESFAGEVGGAMVASIPFVRGAQMVSGGAKLAPAIGEAIYGAGYGAGESNENRLLGAALGGGAGLGGGLLANRLLPTPELPKAALTPEAPPPTGGMPAGIIPEGPPPAPPPPPAGGMAAGIAPDGTPPPTGGMAAEVPPTEDTTELGSIILDAIGTGKKAKVAKNKLAEMAQVNLEAKAAAERLGIEVPADVFSDNPQIRSAIGAFRSQVASEDEAAWRTVVSNAVDQADNVMRDFDAQFVEGTISPGTVSERVRDSLTSTRSALNKEAGDIYKQVDAAVPKQTPVQMESLSRTLGEIASEVGEKGMTAQELRLQGMLKGDDVTYGRLMREKTLIGQALKKQESPYGSMDEATLKRLYAALSTDQLANVERIGGKELRDQLRGANLIYAKERALGKRIVDAYGEDLLGGIARKMTGAITESAKGDPGAFTRLMKAVPDDLKKEVVATALAAASRSNQGAQKGGFGFSEFAALYDKLRANPPVYKQIVGALGPKSDGALRDLYQVSKRITEARANVLTTGKANQLPIIQQLRAEKLVAKVMDSAAAKRTVGAAAGFTGPLAPALGAILPDIMEAMSKGSPDAVAAAGKMFSSPEFEALAIELATKPEPSKKAINRVATSQQFRDFAKRIGLAPKDGPSWLQSAITVGAVGQATPEPTQPDGVVIEIPR